MAGFKETTEGVWALEQRADHFVAPAKLRPDVRPGHHGHWCDHDDTLRLAANRDPLANLPQMRKLRGSIVVDGSWVLNGLHLRLPEQPPASKSHFDPQ
jgi:hypothetical protein